MRDRSIDDAIDDMRDDIDENDDYDVFVGGEKIEREDGVKRCCVT